MILDAHFNKTLALLLSSQPDKVAVEQLISCIDLTLLDEQASSESLAQLKNNACTHNVAAICVHIKHLMDCAHSGNVALATVINFPYGTEDIETSLERINYATSLGATEIDYVLPYHAYLNGKKQEALAQCQAVINQCQKKQLRLKIILETGAFPHLDSIYEVSTSLIKAGCHFIKTSTGKIPQGASLSAAFAILSALEDTKGDCGIKISGGVKTPVQALHYAQLAQLMLGKHIDKHWFRIGASGLLTELTRDMDQNKANPSVPT